MRNREAEMRIRQVVKNIMVTSPFFAQLALRPELIEESDLPAPMTTDGEVIWYNPAWVLKLPYNVLEYVFKHELLHRILGHCDDKENSRLPNEKCRLIASDLAVNGIMMTAENYIPEESILPGCFPGVGMFRDVPLDATRDTYYNLLVEAEEKQQQQQKQQQGGSSSEKQQDNQNTAGDEKGGEEGDPDNDGDPETGEPHSDDTSDSDGDRDSDERGGKSSGGKHNGRSKRKGKGKSESDESVDSGKDGNEAEDDVGDEDEDTEESDDSAEGRAQGKTQQEKLEELIEAIKNGEVDKRACDVVSCDEDKVQEMKQEIMADMVMAQVGEQLSAGRGTMGGYGALVAKMLSPPKIPWRRELRQFMTARTTQRMNYHKPSRRYREDMITPRRGNKTLGKVIIVADTSGSMATVLPKIASEVQGLVKEFSDSELFMVMCDAVVQTDLINIGRGSTFDFKTIQWKGLGGTDMRPGFIFAEKFRPSLIICATDLAIGEFPARPNCPVIWCIADLCGMVQRHKVPYGNLIVIPKSELR
jgi:predicted metal-dependent peptidase